MSTFFPKMNTRRDFLETMARLCFQLGFSSFLLGCAKADSADRDGNAEPDASGKSGAHFDLEPLAKDGATTTTESVRAASAFEPAYRKLHRSGELKTRGEALWGKMQRCELCPRRCGANRLQGRTGLCRAPGTALIVSSAHAHYGEERPLVGSGGSGTIFLSHCNLRCVFCQNWEISHLGRGAEITLDELAATMLRLQRSGCHNINLVTPTHYTPHILRALDRAAAQGLRLPVVYNTCGWECPDVLGVLDGVVDIYMPDFKYWDGDVAAAYSAGAASYPEVTRAAILEMNRQVDGKSIYTDDGILLRGLILRHLVMPNNAGGSERVMEWIAANLPKDTYVNIMAQYTPAHKAFDFPELSRRITGEEYRKVVETAQAAGLTNLDIQGRGWLRR